jgi:hypothetical protein
MNPSLYVVIGAISGALVTAVGTAALTYFQRREDRYNDRRQRYFEAHLAKYEAVFVAARTVQDALRDYVNVERKRAGAHDPFLEMLLDILKAASYSYCVSVDWRHNPEMAYLNWKLESQALRARNLLLKWLSVQRVSVRPLIYVVADGEQKRVLRADLRRRSLDSYSELRVENRRVVVANRGDRRLASQIDKSLSRVIKQLKDVIAY